jgi:hypothetical protein
MRPSADRSWLRPGCDAHPDDPAHRRCRRTVESFRRESADHRTIVGFVRSAGQRPHGSALGSRRAAKTRRARPTHHRSLEESSAKAPLTRTGSGLGIHGKPARKPAPTTNQANTRPSLTAAPPASLRPTNPRAPDISANGWSPARTNWHCARSSTPAREIWRIRFLPHPLPLR